MRKFIYLLCVSFVVLGCDDGDVMEVNLEFGNTFKNCGNTVFYKTKTTPPESLSIFINNLSIEDLVKTAYVNTDSVFVELTYTSGVPIPINGTTNKINYRTYSSLPANPFCSDVPGSDLTITNDAVGTGNVLITVTLMEDDNDGIPAEFEDINGNGDLNDDDTDGDGIPNYLDDDDDGDNVKTIDEQHNFSDNNDLSNVEDSDGDGIPNYLDNDDDGDGVPTRDERSLAPDLHNPAISITNPDIGPDFLNPNVTVSVPETVYRDHVIRQNFVIKIEIINLSIPQLSQDYFNFGTLDNPNITTATRTPKAIFN